MRLATLFVFLAAPALAGCWNRDPFPDHGVDHGPDLALDGLADVRGDIQQALDRGPDWGANAPFVWADLKAATFTMGSPVTERCHTYEEELHQVTLTHPFRITTTEVTQHQFYQVMRYNRSVNGGCGANCPVEGVTWHEAAAFCNAASKLDKLTPCYSCTGKDHLIVCEVDKQYLGVKLYQCPGYRLPTEAEWEYAYRAGTQTPLYNGTTIGCGDTRDVALYPDPKTDPGIDHNAWDIAWYVSSADGQTRPVGQLTPNAWGLYDMAGNVWEWVHDWRAPNGSAAVSDPTGPDTGNDRVIRGGGIDSMTMYLRGAYRNLHDPTYYDTYIGFRIAQTIK